MSISEENTLLERIFQKWERKLAQLTESDTDISMKTKVDGEEKLILSPGTKLRHMGKKKDKKGFVYTISSVDAEGAVLKTPEGKLFNVDKQTLESEYDLE